MGLSKLLSGVISYQAKLRPQLLKQFQAVKDKPNPKAVMFSCMDSRILITRLLQCDVGEMFVVRNAGNLVPHQESTSFQSITTEPGALELCCVINNIRHVLVCGHSDCKAMNALYEIRDSVQDPSGSPLQLWLKRHGVKTVQKYETLQKLGGVGPLSFQAETPKQIFQAYIDEENKFAPVDKFSQVNTLQQVENIASQSFLKTKLEKDEVRVNALWFDIYSGDFFMFSRERKRFVLVSEDTHEHLVQDGESNPMGA